MSNTNEAEITKLALGVMDDERLREARIADYLAGVSLGDWGENQLKMLAEITGIDLEDTDHLLEVAAAVSKERMRGENDRARREYYDELLRENERYGE